MIERKAFLRITKAMILGLRNGLANPSERIKQNIIEELAAILGVERCVIFKVSRDEVDDAIHDFCEIIAGVPLSEYQSDFAKSEPLEIHPDLKAAVKNKGIGSRTMVSRYAASAATERATEVGKRLSPGDKL